MFWKVGWGLIIMVETMGFKPTTFCLQGRRSISWAKPPKMVGINGLEPSTSPLSGECSNQLSYTPIFKAQKIPSNYNTKN